MKNERDPVFCTAVMPYYSLFVQSIQEYFKGTYLEGDAIRRIKSIRNNIKAFSDGFGKTQKRLRDIDRTQDEQFRNHLKFEFMQEWNVHYNLGIYFSEDRFPVGNTQMIADCLGIEDVYAPDAGMKMKDVAIQMGRFVSSVRNGLEGSFERPTMRYRANSTSICFYSDININRERQMFKYENKELDLFFLNLLCGLNFVKHILVKKLVDMCSWFFRV